jgi:hypothetical protein
MFTDKLLNIILVKSNHYYQQHIVRQEDKFDEIFLMMNCIILQL